ncbi:MAG TPA: pyridoxal phosphate-dependent aminotransferase [Vicinamibacterales bacterium]|nr:pyridoxal phosphate-dependent aminotransferase [Vicinamibacterales bacterium]
MIEAPLAPYLLWAKTRQPAAIDLAGSNLVHCAMDDLPGAREALELTAPNDNGFPPVVEAIASHYSVGTDRIVTAIGCSGANFITAAALLSAGDEVLIERPTYDPLIGVCRLMGATVIRFERRFENGFAIDPDEIARLVTPRTRLIVLTTPHNPSGVRVPPETLAAVVRHADSYGAHVLVDEVYLDGWCGVAAVKTGSRSAAAQDGPVVVTSSLTKSYGLAGLRSGWAIAPPATAERMRRARDVIDNASPAPGDRLAALAWTLQPALAARARAILTTNIAIAREFFGAHPELLLAESPACSVTFPRVAGASDSALFVQRALAQGVAVAPGHFFEADAHFRISLAGKTETLEEGLAILTRVLRDLRVRQD